MAYADDNTTDSEDTELNVIKGDVSGDGNINVSDIAMLASHIKGIRSIK
jgi:Dockerin type I repeat.